jgi:SagB-type dehydrogenase family enzyme
MSDYHRETAYQRDAMWGYALDWAHQPSPFKQYKHREAAPLPRPRPPQAGFFELVYGWPPKPAELERKPDASDLAAVMLMSAGITNRSHRVAEGLRAPASAGALFPSELYAVTCGFPGMEDALYHFDVSKPGLTQLWQEKLAAAASRASGSPPSQLSFFITTMFWRSVWKYRSRAYRYCLLDAGHMLANLELSLAACGMAPLPRWDFADSSAGALLGLPSEDEAALTLVHAGLRPNEPGNERPGLPPWICRPSPCPPP